MNDFIGIWQGTLYIPNWEKHFPFSGIHVVQRSSSDRSQRHATSKSSSLVSIWFSIMSLTALRLTWNPHCTNQTKSEARRQLALQSKVQTCPHTVLKPMHTLPHTHRYADACVLECMRVHMYCMYTYAYTYADIHSCMHASYTYTYAHTYLKRKTVHPSTYMYT